MMNSYRREFTEIQNCRELKKMIEMREITPCFDEALKEDILRVAKQSYDNVRNCWTGEECFSCALMHDFFQNLIHLHCPEVTEILRAKIQEHLQRTPSKTQSCINAHCYSFESAAWKNSQKAAVLSILETVLALMMDTSCRSAKPSERNDALLDLDYEINCACSKCKAPSAHSARIIRESTEEEAQYNSLKVIEQCLRSPNAQKIHLHQSAKINKIFDLLRDERKQRAQAKQVKQKRHQLIFGLYGTLLGLEKEKTIEDASLDELEQRKAKIYEELLKKNTNNQRIIRRFNRKISLQRNQEKIARLACNDLASSAPLSSRSSHKETPSPSASPSPLSSSRLLRRIPANKLGRKQALEPIGNIQDCIAHYTRMQERVDRALKNFEPREEKRTCILKSIVLNASDMFSERRAFPKHTLNRPFFNRFEKTSREMSKEIKA